MTFIEIVDLFTCYGLDILALAVITAVICGLVRSVVKRVSARLYTFLPFLIGVALYIAYAAITRLSFVYVLKNFTEVTGHGVSTGALATGILFFFGHFLKGDISLDLSAMIAEMLEGFVSEGELGDAAKEIAATV